MTNEELIQLQADIKDAKRKYHALMTGTAVTVFVDQNGERIEYSRVSANSLAAYITSLEAQLPGASSPYARPLRFVFNR